MKLLTYDAGSGARVGLATEDGIVDLTTRTGVTSLRELIAADRVAEMAEHEGETPDHALDAITYLPVIPDPAHI